MVKMIASKSFPYQGRSLKKGDKFVARDKSHARQLRGAGFASDAGIEIHEAKTLVVKPVVSPVISEPEDAQAAEKNTAKDRYETKQKDAPKEKRAKGKDGYQTRVLNAEG